MQPHPLCCSALQLPATLSSLSRDLCRCNSERPLCTLFPLLSKPWKLLWAGNSPHLLPFSFPFSTAAMVLLPMVQCLRCVSYLSVLFFFLSCLKQEVNLVHCGCKQKSVFTFESEFQGFVLPKKDYILLILEGGTF